LPASPSVDRFTCATSDCSRPPSIGHGQAFSADAYPDLFTKAAALLHSQARNHPLVDGNKRLAWLATHVFCATNGVELDPDDDAHTTS
jgi:prophage maintenance system killer protein